MEVAGVEAAVVVPVGGAAPAAVVVPAVAPAAGVVPAVVVVPAAAVVRAQVPVLAQGPPGLGWASGSAVQQAPLAAPASASAHPDRREAPEAGMAPA